jgi:guanylate kinase
MNYHPFRGVRGMKNIFLIDGASGVGKSDLLRWVNDNHAHKSAYVEKTTTREKRPYEANDPDILLDLKFVSESEFAQDSFDYMYTYGGSHYGLNKKDILDAIRINDNVFIVVRSTTIIQRICSDFSFMTVVPIFVYTDGAQLTKRLKQKGFTDEQIDIRIKRSEIAMREYYTHPELYREVIINNSVHDVFHTTIERILHKYVATIFIDHNLISVMMSYNSTNKSLDDYFDAMVAAIKELSGNYFCHRIDMRPGSNEISREFATIASRSICVIVDLTENKSNVYYELGYLHGIKKPCIITASKDTIPAFYPSQYKILFYASARELREILRHELSGVLGTNLPATAGL